MEFDDAARRRIAAAVRARRDELGLSQEQVARASGGMISTASLRVVEGTGRGTFRNRSLVGVARGLRWPDDAIERIGRGDDPASLPTARIGARSAAPGADDPIPVAGTLALATASEVDRLRRELADHRAAIEELESRVRGLVTALGRGASFPDTPLLAAYDGDDHSSRPARRPRRRAAPPRVDPPET